AGAMAERPPSERAAEARFRELAARARGRYRDETIRREGATLRVAPAPAAASSALPPPAAGGAMVVTLLVASARRLPPPGEPRDARAIRGALARLERIGRAQLRAVEVVWSPSAAGEPFGETEVDALYPELVEVEPATIEARGGSLAPAAGAP